MSLTSFIARVGVSPEWIAAQAHIWFAYAVVHTFGYAAIAPMVIAAGVKEFYFDARYEVPKQTATDNWTDFAGYCLGVVLAAVALRWM